jgi:hypothetical protein
MPIEVGLWRLGERMTRVEFSPIDSESRLESLLAKDVSIIDPELLLVGRQVPTAFTKFIDLLALDSVGNVVVIELKKNRTPREVVAQLLDYGSWVRGLQDEDIASLYSEYVKRWAPQPAELSLDQAFCEKFNLQEMPEALNESHELVLVAGELDESSERIISYLAEEYGVAINAIFFRFFRDGDREYLSRAWLIDPSEADAKVEQKREKGEWNGESYGSFGVNTNRDWNEAMKYGFISAGGGAWYSRTLGILEPGDRVWVNIPSVGYVGVGIVEDKAVPLDEFLVNNESGKHVPINELPLKAARLTSLADDIEKAEHFVRIKWIKTIPLSQAVKEKGFFGNQNSAAKPRAKKWQYTVDRLKQRFGVE